MSIVGRGGVGDLGWFEMRLVGVVSGMMVFRARVAVKERAREGFVRFCYGWSEGGRLLALAICDLVVCFGGAF